MLLKEHSKEMPDCLRNCMRRWAAGCNLIHSLHVAQVLCVFVRNGRQILVSHSPFSRISSIWQAFSALTDELRQLFSPANTKHNPHTVAPYQPRLYF